MIELNKKQFIRRFTPSPTNPSDYGHNGWRGDNKGGHKRPRWRVFVVGGFTLIELLVVVFIVVLLASIVTVSLSTSRKRARDARRVVDINQVRIALEQFFSVEKNYPPPDFGPAGGYCALSSQLAPYLALGVFPRDPLDTGSSCGALSGYEYYVDIPSLPREWLLVVSDSTLELPSSMSEALGDDVDGVIGSQNGGWVGGADTTSCTFGAPDIYSCSTIDCGSAVNDTIYCIRSS